MVVSCTCTVDILINRAISKTNICTEIIGLSWESGDWHNRYQFLQLHESSTSDSAVIACPPSLAQMSFDSRNFSPLARTGGPYINANLSHYRVG